MQLKQFSVVGLFGYLTHKIPFPLPPVEAGHAAVSIIHGRNGVGKTTVLRMIDGLLRLDFNVFRTVPFSSCKLEFTEGRAIVVKPVGTKTTEALEVSYNGGKVFLNPKETGPLTKDEWPAVEKFRSLFFAASEDIAFEFIDTERLYRGTREEGLEHKSLYSLEAFAPAALLRTRQNPKAKQIDFSRGIAERVAGFIREAQVNYRRFFSTKEPDLFPRIIERLAAPKQIDLNPSDLKARLARVHTQDQDTGRMGLEPDRWDYDQLVTQLEALANKHGETRNQALAVLDAYVELLESRAAERALVAQRVHTFERVMSEFMPDKKILVNAKSGLQITNSEGVLLGERQLSSGEFHLLYLMVAALVTRRRGTVIAIDEPEMSMHIAWQRQLVNALVDCASGAEPLFIFATHSPDIAATYQDALIELTGPTG